MIRDTNHDSLNLQAESNYRSIILYAFWTHQIFQFFCVNMQIKKKVLSVRREPQINIFFKLIIPTNQNMCYLHYQIYHIIMMKIQRTVNVPRREVQFINILNYIYNLYARKYVCCYRFFFFLILTAAAKYNFYYIMLTQLILEVLLL